MTPLIFIHFFVYCEKYKPPLCIYPKPLSATPTSASPASNNVNLMVETVILNYMALHGQQNLFAQEQFFPGHGLGGAAARDRLVAFEPLQSMNGGVLS